MSAPTATALLAVSGPAATALHVRPGIRPGGKLHATKDTAASFGSTVTTSCGRTLYVTHVRPVDWSATVRAHWTKTCGKCMSVTGESRPD